MSKTQDPPYKRFGCVTDDEICAQSLAFDGLENYTFGNKLEEVYEPKGDLLQEVWLATENTNNEVNYTIRITELRDINVTQYVLHEVNVLQKLGIDKRIMGAFAVFRNKAYVAYVQPAYTSIRNRIVARYRFKKGEDDALSENEMNVPDNASEVFSEIRKELKTSPGVLNRNSVAFVLRKVVKGLRYLHDHGLVHTQLNSADIYMNELCYVKLSGFGYCRRIGSKNWQFNGNSNFFAPEACLPPDGKRSIEPSFDIYGLGLLTMELISGRRPNYNNDGAHKYLKNLVESTEELPSLKEYDKSCYQNGRCIYDNDIEDFLSKLIVLDPSQRLELEQAYRHPFLSREVDKTKAAEMWTPNEILMSSEESSRVLRDEMLESQGCNNDMNADHLSRIVNAIQLAKKESFPVFNVVPEDKLFSDYFGIEASVATPFIENEWSREVLDISDEQIGRFGRYCEAYKLDSNTLSTGKPPNYYNRSDQILFVKREWPIEERQLFVALQFSRWFNQGFIEFPDVIQLCSDIEYLVKEYVTGRKQDDFPTKILWSIQMRRLIKNPTLYDDPTTRSLCHIYNSISVRPGDMRRVKQKYNDLMRDDPIEVYNGKTTLSLSIMFRELDLDRFRKMEDVLNQKRVEELDYDYDQRRVDSEVRANRLR